MSVAPCRVSGRVRSVLAVLSKARRLLSSYDARGNRQARAPGGGDAGGGAGAGDQALPGGRGEQTRGGGAKALLETFDAFNRELAGTEGMRALLAQEQERALRILTSSAGL